MINERKWFEQIPNQVSSVLLGSTKKKVLCDVSIEIWITIKLFICYFILELKKKTVNSIAHVHFIFLR